jgi:prevent-host-death family protein
VEISSAEAGRNFAQVREQAEMEPVVVLHYNKPSVVILSAAEFARLKRRDRQVLLAEEMPDWLADLVMAGEVDARHAYLDDVVAPPDFIAAYEKNSGAAEP